MRGPEGSDYEGKIFDLEIRFPENYPLSPPNIRFTSRIDHPNISTETGQVTLDVLNHAWDPKIASLSQILQTVFAMLKPKSPSVKDTDLLNITMSSKRKQKDCFKPSE